MRIFAYNIIIMVGKDIAALEAEQKHIENALCGGTISVEEITEMSKRLPSMSPTTYPTFISISGMRLSQIITVSTRI